MNVLTPNEQESPLHQVAKFSPETSSDDVIIGMANMARLMLQEGAAVNAQDSMGWWVHRVGVKSNRVAC